MLTHSSLFCQNVNAHNDMNTLCQILRELENYVLMPTKPYTPPPSNPIQTTSSRALSTATRTGRHDSGSDSGTGNNYNNSTVILHALHYINDKLFWDFVATVHDFYYQRQECTTHSLVAMCSPQKLFIWLTLPKFYVLVDRAPCPPWNWSTPDLRKKLGKWRPNTLTLLETNSIFNKFDFWIFSLNIYFKTFATTRTGQTEVRNQQKTFPESFLTLWRKSSRSSCWATSPTTRS